jgi:hypothetical protein
VKALFDGAGDKIQVQADKPTEGLEPHVTRYSTAKPGRHFLAYEIFDLKSRNLKPIE